MLDTLYVIDTVAKLRHDELREDRRNRRLPRLRIRNRY